MIRSGIDTYVLYTIVRRLAQPFHEWKAYKLGVIDDKGTFLIDKADRTPEQYRSLTYLDVFVMNLKKILSKVPAGNNRIVTYAAALWLLREDRFEHMDMLNEDGESMVPANTSTDGIARSSAGEANAFKRKLIQQKRLKSD
jgi:hypothetical protein